MLSISKGNKKVDAAIFNLPCQVTCKPELECFKYCYAKKAENLYPNVKPSRVRNLESTITDSFITDMIASIKKTKKLYFRFLESGDFYSKEFVLKCYAIANAMPEIKFYGYTKRDDVFTQELLDVRPSNFTLTWSIDGIQSGDVVNTIPKGYDNISVVHATKTNCPAQLNKELKCMKDCFKCQEKKGRVIIFKKH
jgi:hypothetical protein